MKRCPHCRRSYEDETLNFCLEDGEWLIGANHEREPQTAVLYEDDLSGDAPTRRIADISDRHHQAHPTSSAEYIIRSIREHKKAVILGLIAVVLVLGGIGFGLYRRLQKVSQAFETIRITKLTNTSNIGDVRISPNGEFVAMVVVENGKYRVRILDVKTKSFADITPPTEDGLQVAGFSSDNRQVYFTRHVRYSQGDLYEIGRLGGAPPRKILERSGLPALSKDDKMWAFIRPGPGPNENSLFVSNADGTGERSIATRKVDQQFVTSYGPVAWSPDGRFLACTVSSGAGQELAVASVESGELTLITDREWRAITGPTWLHDGSGIVFGGSQGLVDTPIWLASYPEGKLRKVTDEASILSPKGITADSSIIVAIQSERLGKVFVAPLNDPTNANLIVREGPDGMAYNRLAWTSDGKIVFSNAAADNMEVWITNSDGTGTLQLTSDPAWDGWPTVSPDGRHILFSSSRSGRMNIWRINADGSDPRQLSDGIFDRHADVSPDGKWIVFQSRSDLRRVPIEGGESVRLFDKYVITPSVSQKDGSIAGIYRKDPASAWLLAVFAPDGGEPLETFGLPDGRPSHSLWTPDGRSIMYVINQGEIASMWSQSIDGGPPKKIADFPEKIFSFALSRDGKSIAYSRGSSSGNVVLITDTSRE